MKIYLAIPYTFNAELSYNISNEVAAKLMGDGHVVFSPISHSHAIADYMDESLRYSQEFWMAQDLPLIEWCDKVVCVVIGEFGYELIDKSIGVQSELKEANKLNKQIEFYYYEKK